MKRVAINGLGRIGRLVLREYLRGGYDDIDIVAANDLVSIDNLAYLLKFDSVHGRAGFPVELDGTGALRLNGRSIPIHAQPDPARLPWSELGIDVVIDASGRFKKRADAMRHINAGARRVLISAPSPDADVTIVMGVNAADFDPDRHLILSNASCTTNSLAPVMKVLLDNFGVEMAHVTTVHAYTISQNMVDGAKDSMIRGRAGAVNIIPTSTGADKATVAVLPALKDRLAAVALRVPVADGAITDISVELGRDASADELNAAFGAAADGAMRGILAISDEELASSDILGDPHSAIVHALSTKVIRGRFAKIQVWYDNEFAYAKRCLDMIQQLPM
jgi:glyceraldehyde 3-phosphate dehydrogenase/glyceraldehyde-3-phosphate dehydrogenase (NAD(P))